MTQTDSDGPYVNGPQEYLAAQFLFTALARMNTWNATHHPAVCACWFIYPRDYGWPGCSLLGMKNSDTSDHDAWHAFQYAAGFNYPAGRASTSQPSVLCDFDQDGDVDMEDFGRFQRCLIGPGEPQNDPACAGARLDDDGDVDQNDTPRFLRCLGGANVVVSADCSDWWDGRGSIGPLCRPGPVRWL